VASVWWDSPAFKAGMAPGASIIAINGKTASNDAMKEAITAAKDAKTPIEIIYKVDDNYKTVSIPYYDGLRYPKLERIADKPALLDAILAEKP
jgi:C-terminal processing protease CtpA/Prc